MKVAGGRVEFCFALLGEEGTSTTLGPWEKSKQKAAGRSQATSVLVYDHGWRVCERRVG